MCPHCCSENIVEIHGEDWFDSFFEIGLRCEDCGFEYAIPAAVPTGSNISLDVSPEDLYESSAIDLLATDTLKEPPECTVAITFYDPVMKELGFAPESTIIMSLRYESKDETIRYTLLPSPDAPRFTRRYWNGFCSRSTKEDVGLFLSLVYGHILDEMEKLKISESKGIVIQLRGMTKINHDMNETSKHPEDMPF